MRKPIHILNYGASGTGKTKWSCSWPHVFVFDFDNGLLSVTPKLAEDRFKIYENPKPSLANAFSIFEKDLLAVVKRDDVQTIVIDSLSSLQHALMLEVLRLHGQAGQLPQIQHWGVLVYKVRFLMYLVRTFNKDLIVTAHESEHGNDLTGDRKIKPALFGKEMPDTVCGFFDFVWRSEVRHRGRELSFQLLTQKTPLYVAKSRLDCFERYIVQDSKVIRETIVKALNEREGGRDVQRQDARPIPDAN